MRNARVYGIAGLAILAVAAVAVAQTTVNPLPEAAPAETISIDAAAATDAVAALADAGERVRQVRAAMEDFARILVDRAA